MEANPSGESLLSLMTWAMWGLVGLCALFYFVSSYLFEILAQKHDEPRWMAWVPIVNGFLMLRLVGWEKWFWVMLIGYVVALGSMFLPGPLMFVGAIAIIPLVITGIAIGLGYFPRLAKRRGLSVGVGLWVVVPQFVAPLVAGSMPEVSVVVSLLATLAAGLAFLKIVFHDGKPQSWPHPIGYALTVFGVLVAGAALQALPGRLADDDGFQQAWQQMALQLESTPMAEIRGWADASEEAITEMVPTASPLLEPDPVSIATTCPRNTREASEAQNGGRTWWCEIEAENGWVRHGPSRSWFANGFVETEGEYDHGLRTGTWTRYWRSGGRHVQADFRDDVQHGWMHRWDADENFETAVRYEQGEPAAL